MRERPGTAGYSLLELMVVIAIMAIVATAGLPYVSGSLDRFSLEGDARRVASQIRLLRETAMDLQKDITVAPRADGASELVTSEGMIIPLSGSTTVTIVTDAPDGKLLVGWDGTVSGAIVLTDGNRKFRLRQKGILTPLVVEAVR